MKRIFFILLFLSLFAQHAFANLKRQKKYHYSYINRYHTKTERLTHIAAIYGVSWLTYFATQPVVVMEEGSLQKYRQNFGKLVFDKDEPFWNWIVHPYSGSQLYLFYRATGYSRIEAVQMAFISSTLFEFAVEIYTEPASIQDLYQTPVLGSSLGLVLEEFSLYLLNSGVPFYKFFGHVLNPATLFWFYEGKVLINPIYNNKTKTTGINFMMDF